MNNRVHDMYPKFFFLIFCKTCFFYFLIGSLSIIIHSYNENRAQIMCRNVYKQVPSILAYMRWYNLP